MECHANCSLCLYESLHFRNISYIHYTYSYLYSDLHVVGRMFTGHCLKSSSPFHAWWCLDALLWPLTFRMFRHGWVYLARCVWSRHQRLPCSSRWDVRGCDKTSVSDDLGMTTGWSTASDRYVEAILNRLSCSTMSRQPGAGPPKALSTITFDYLSLACHRTHRTRDIH